MFSLLETKRLLLRPLEISDAERIEELASDYEIAKTTLNIPHPYLEGSAVDFIKIVLAKKEEDLIVNYAMINQQTNAFIGLIGLHMNPPHENAELCYWVGKPYWNLGYGTEAVKAVIDYGFTTLDLH